MAIQMGRSLAFTAFSGVVAGLMGCGGEQKAVETPGGGPAAETGGPPPAAGEAAPADAAKACCKGKNECKGKGKCKTDANTCAGKNECKGKGGCNAGCPEAAH